MSAVVDVRDVFCLHPLADGGAVAALRGLSLQVAPGERLVVHGPNGSGKTTLLKVLAGEQRLAAGRAVVAGQDLAGAGARPLAAWRSRQLGQVDQNAGRLLRPEFDVLDNVSLQLRLAGVSRTAARATGLASLERLGLADLAHRRPGTLSGGQRQRVAVCAALAHGPELVLADEPTGELDLASADAVYDLLGSAVRDAGATLVLVTHDRRAARIADRVVRIRDGRISETWHPGSGGESLVVDPRGWVRLPLALRRSLALGSSVSAEPLDGTLVLSPTHPSRTTPAPLPATEEVWTETPARRDQKSSVAGVVRAGLKGVVVGYDGRNVLDGVDLSVRAGELVVVAGRSGAGKSTLLRVLLGLQRPDAGTVHLDGVDLTGLDRSALAALRAATTAVVMQQIHLADTADAAGNLDLARAARRLPADPGLADLLAARLGLAGLAAVGGRPVSGLSGGERQRLAVARALAVEPALLVLDEPTSQLDETSAELMALTLRQAAASGNAILVASHDPVLLAAADEVQELP